MKANFEWFRTFKAIYETGTMSEAAKELNISQPGVSLHLNSLEAYTGYPLFERTVRKMIPTERAKILYRQLNPALQTLEDAEHRFRQKPGADRVTLSVGMCVESFQQAFEKHIPNTDFNLIMQFGENTKLNDLLESGAVDLVVTTLQKPSANLIYQPFASEKLWLVAGNNTDTSGFDALDVQDKNKLTKWLQSQLWYSTHADMQMLIRFWEQNFRQQPHFVPNYIVPNKFSIVRCLSMGDGLAVLPDFICRDAIAQGNIRLLWEGYNPIENPLYFGKRKNALLVDQIEWVEQMLIKEFDCR